MELLYLWVEEYINIDNCGFNLSSKVKIDHKTDKDQHHLEFAISKNENFIENFFSDNVIEVMGIVGANGVGKSNFLECLTYFLTTKGAKIDKWVAIFLEPRLKKLKIFHSLEIKGDLNSKVPIASRWEISIENKSDYKLYKIERAHSELNYSLKNPPRSGRKIDQLNADVIFYSPLFDLRNYSEYRQSNLSYGDISTNYLIDFDFREEPDDRDKVEVHKFRNLERQFVFASQHQDFIKEINFPSEIEIRFVKSFSNDEIRKDDQGSKAKKFYEKFRNSVTSKWNSFPNKIMEEGRTKRSRQIYEDGKKMKCKWWFAVDLITNFLYNVSYEVDLHDRYFNVSSNLIEFDFKNDDPLKLAKDFFKLQSFVNKKRFDHNAFIDLVTNTIDTNGDVLYIDEENECWFYTDAKSGLEIFKEHRKYTQSFKKKNSQHGFLDINMRSISSGEKSFMDLFSRVYWSLTDQINASPRRIIYLLIDEGEAGFHPKWQKNYLNLLIKYLGNFSKFKFKILLATHSPFIISDLPVENLILLAKNNLGKPFIQKSLNSMNETFGANIHLLLSDAFFMDEGLMGEFAKRKITSLFKLDKIESKKEKEDYKKMVNIIGEPLIKIKLLELYAKKRGVNYEKEQILEQIEILNKRLGEIENEL